MAKTCSACHQTYSDDLKQCPHCSVRDASLDRRSSGEFFLDAPGTDLAKHGEIVTRGPEESDEIVEIDWSAIEEDGGEHSSVVDLGKEAYVEVELPSAIDPAKNQPRHEQPSSAEIVLPPMPEIVHDNPAVSVPLAKKVEPSESAPALAGQVTNPVPGKPEGGKATKVVAGQRPPTQLAEKAPAAPIAPPLDSEANLFKEPPLAAPAPRSAANEQPSSFTLGKPVSPGDEPSTPVDWNDEELIEIEPDAAGDESSMVDLGSGPHRRPEKGGLSSAPLSPPPRSPAQDAAVVSENLFAESSALDLGSSEETNVPSAALSGVALHRRGSPADDEPAILDEPEAIALEEDITKPRGKKRGSGLGMVVTGLGGAAFGAAACVGLWFAGYSLPESLRRGNDNKPIVARQLNASTANPEPSKNADSAKKSETEIARAPASQDDGKAQFLLTALQSKLAESKYISEEQPDPIKAVEQLLRDNEAAKKSASAPKAGDGSLEAALKALKDEKYLGPDQTDVAGGIARLAKDKKSIEEQFTKAVADQKAATEKLTKAMEDAKAAEETAKLATEQAKTTAAKLKDLETQSKTSTEKIKDLTAQAKAAEDKVRTASDSVNAANDKIRAALEQANASQSTVKAIAAKFAAAKIIKPDAGGDDLVKAVDQVVRLANQPQPAANTAPAMTAPTPMPTPRQAPTVAAVGQTEYRYDPIRAERYFSRGLSQFWERQYAAAEGDFEEASRLAGPAAQDARFLYFQGLSELAQGKTQQANGSFTNAGRLERSNRPGPAAVNASLERVQGGARQYLEAFRR